MIGFVAQWESAIVHGDENAGLHFDKSTDGLLGIHVHVPAAGSIIGADGHQCDIGGVMLADFLEAVKVGTISTVKDFTDPR